IRNLGSPGGGGPPAVGRPAPPDGAGGGRASGEGTRCPGASVTRADLSRSAKPASTNWRINVVAPMPRASAAARMRWSTSTGRRRERLTMGTSVSGAGRVASTPPAMTSDRSWAKTSLIRASHVLGEHGDLVGEHVAGGHDVPAVFWCKAAMRRAPTPYGTTAVIAVEAAGRLVADSAKPGVLTPAQAYDPTSFLNLLAPHAITWTI